MAPGTVQRGLNQAVLHFLSRNEKNGELYPPTICEDFMGIKGLRYANYTYFIPQTKDANLLYIIKGFQEAIKGFEQALSPTIHVFDFPLLSRVKTRLQVDEESQTVATTDFILNEPEAIATFTGPTYDQGDLPNNGYFTKEHGVLVEFKDTNPSGLRRGAFAFTDEGNMIVLDDTLKWAAVRAGFPGIETLVGTSYFITAADPLEWHLQTASSGRSQISYLFQHLQAPGLIRTGFAITDKVITRATMKRVLDHYTNTVSSKGYIGVEMELTGSHLSLRTPEPEIIETFGGLGFFDRWDHYFVIPSGNQNVPDELFTTLASNLAPRITFPCALSSSSIQ